MKQSISSELQLIIHNNKMRKRNCLVIRCLWAFVIIVLIITSILVHSIKGANTIAYWTMLVPLILLKAYGAQLLISDIGVITEYDIKLHQHKMKNK